jgi:SSS family solute:Na+ symporter
MGVAVGAVFVHFPDLRDAVPDDHLDYLVPQFILLHIPTGLRALLFAAILAAAMSSLDSAINSLSASTMRDFVERGRDLSERRILLFSKLTTVLWGLAITGFAFLVGNISSTVLEGINKIGSAFYGPILASFLIGVLSKRANATGIFVGVITGVGFNLFLWLNIKELFWMWWNLLGLLISIVTTIIISWVTAPPGPEQINNYTLKGSGMLKQDRRWIKSYVLLGIYFIFIILFMVLVQKFTG